MKKFISIGVLGSALLLGCTPKSTPPNIDSPGSKVNIESCRNTSLNFQKVHAENIRSLVNCLNGNQKSIQPYKDFLDTADTEDLNILFESLNRYLTWGSPRQIHFLDVIKAAKQKGLLKSLLTDVQVLTESGLLGSFVSAASPLLEDNSVAQPDPDLDSLRLFLKETLKDKFDEKLLDALSIFGKKHAQVLSHLLSLPGVEGAIESDHITYLLGNQLLRMIDDQSLHWLFAGMSHPEVLKTFMGSSQSERDGFAQIFKYFSYTQSANNYEAFKKGQRLIEVANKPMTCFKTENSGGRRSENVLKYVISSLEGKSKAEIEQYLLQTVPLLFSTTNQVCQIPQAIITDYDVVTDLVQEGYAESYSQFWTIIMRNSQSDLLVSSLKSPYYVHAAPVIGEFSRRAGVRAFIDSAADDFTPENANTIGFLLSNVTGTYEVGLFKLIKRVLSENSEQRERLKKFSKNLVISWADSRGGLGNALAVSSLISRLTDQKPITGFLSDVLNDKEYFNSLTPVLLRLTQNPHFESALRLTGQLSGNGDLEKMIMFFVDLLRQSNPSLSLESDKVNEVGALPAAVTQEFSNKYLHEKTLEPVSYDSCLKIRGSVYEASGQILLQAIKCLNARGVYPEVDEFAEYLKAKNLLYPVTRILDRAINRSPYTLAVLNQLEALVNKNILTPLLNLYALMGDSQLKIFKLLDSIVVALGTHGSFDKLLNVVTWVSGTREINQNLLSMTELYFKEPQSLYSANNKFRIKVKDPTGIKKQITQWYPGVSAAEVEKIFLTAQENFETHSDAWKHSEGSYPKLSKEEFRNELLGFLSDFLRTTDLEEFIGVFQGYAKDGSALEFVKSLSEQQNVVLLYDENGNTRVRIQTGLDALESLVLLSDFGYSYIENIGTYFQLAVVESNDFARTMRDQYRKVKLGHDAAAIFGPRKKYYRFKNMLSNYSILDHIAANGQMAVLQKLYQALLRATPEIARTSQDPSVNHMGLMNRFNRLGFFQNLSMAIPQISQQGQVNQIVQAVTRMALKVKKSDIPFIKKAFAIILQQATQSQNSAFDKALDLFWNMPNDPEGYEKFKSHLAHVLLAQNEYVADYSAILKTLPTVLGMPTTANKWIENFFVSLPKQNSSIYQISSNSLFLNSASNVKLKRFVSELLARPETSDVIIMLSELYQKQPELFDMWQREWESYWNMPAVENLRPYHILSDVLRALDEEGSRGIGLSLEYLLADPQSRKELVDIVVSMAQAGQLSNLNRYMSKQAGSGEIEEGLHFVFDHFKKASLK